MSDFVRGKAVVDKGNAGSARKVAILRRNHRLDAGSGIGAGDRGCMILFEVDDRHHVLNRGDAVDETFDRMGPRSDRDLFGPTWRPVERECDRAPGFKRHLLEQSPQQRIVRMAMRVDKAGRHDQSARVEGFRRPSAAPRLIAQRDDNLVLDKDVLRRRTMQFTLGIEHQGSRDQNRPLMPPDIGVSRGHFGYVSDLGLGSM
jgi:hypothetical protein